MGEAVLAAGLPAAGSILGSLIGAKSTSDVAREQREQQERLSAQQAGLTREQIQESARQFNIQSEMEKARMAGDIEQFNKLQDLSTQMQNLETQKFQAQQTGNIEQFNAIQQAQRELEQAAMAERGIQFRTQAEQEQAAFEENVRRYGLERAEDIRRYEMGLSEADILRSSYQKALERAGMRGAGAEEAFLTEAGAAAPELQRLAQDIRERGTETMQDVARQTAARLAAGGVRGGQAATQLGRTVGEVGKATQRDINAILAEDAMRRQAERMSYQKALGLGAEQFLLSPESARQYDTGQTFAGLAQERPAVQAEPTTQYPTVPEYPALPSYAPLPTESYTLPELTYEPMGTPETRPAATPLPISQIGSPIPTPVGEIPGLGEQVATGKTPFAVTSDYLRKRLLGLV